MDKLLATFNLLTLNQEEIGNLNRPIISKEVESVIKILPTQMTPRITEESIASLANSGKH